MPSAPRHYVVLGLCGVLVFLLFFVENDLFPTRSWKDAWNLGHIVCFLVAGYTLYAFVPRFATLRLRVQFLGMVLFAALLGALIEFIQGFVGRDVSAQDVVLDVGGGVLAVVVFSPQVRALQRLPKIMLGVAMLAFLTWSTKDLMISLWDEYQAYRQFPLLADFEDRFELGRWSSTTKMAITDEHAWQGRHSLKVRLTPRRYAGVELEHFPHDWSGFTELRLHVLNPAASGLVLTISIYDKQHVQNRYVFVDRYTEQFRLRSGWNTLRLPLNRVKRAPRKRTMAISQVKGVRLFVAQPGAIQNIYIDTLRLEK